MIYIRFLGEVWLKIGFGAFIILLGIWIVVGTLKGLSVKSL